MLVLDWFQRACIVHAVHACSLHVYAMISVHPRKWGLLLILLIQINCLEAFSQQRIFFYQQKLGSNFLVQFEPLSQSAPLRNIHHRKKNSVSLSPQLRPSDCPLVAGWPSWSNDRLAKCPSKCALLSAPSSACLLLPQAAQKHLIEILKYWKYQTSNLTSMNGFRH